MKCKKWAITLLFNSQEKLEHRLFEIVIYLVHYYFLDKCRISDLDATGNLGDQLTNEINHKTFIHLFSREFLNLLHQEGQIIELEATLMEKEQELFKIIIRDGISVDILGSGKMIPRHILGDFISLDPELFLGQDELLIGAATDKNR
jgi:hypothetical protein